MIVRAAAQMGEYNILTYLYNLQFVKSSLSGSSYPMGTRGSFAGGKAAGA
jgi:hypothetical protein